MKTVMNFAAVLALLCTSTFGSPVLNEKRQVTGGTCNKSSDCQCLLGEAVCNNGRCSCTTEALVYATRGYDLGGTCNKSSDCQKQFPGKCTGRMTCSKGTCQCQTLGGTFEDAAAGLAAEPLQGLSSKEIHGYEDDTAAEGKFIEDNNDNATACWCGKCPCE